MNFQTLRRSLIVFLLFVLLHSSVDAVGEFSANYETEYAVSPTGVTIVTQNITLTNNLSNLYPKEYTLLIDSSQIKNIVAYDGKGVINPTISQKNAQTEVILQFNEHVVGVGKTLAFTLRYESSDIAIQQGSIWDVQIPRLIDDPDIKSYEVSLQVPPTFGENAYLTPIPAAGRKWTKEQMLKGGISAAYGAEQYYSLRLTYSLDNPTTDSMRTEIALPPDTAYQKVSITSLEPKPQAIVRDRDGNWMARYDLVANTSVDIEAALTLSVNLKKRQDFGAEVIESSEYTTSAEFWETTDPRIVALANELRTPQAIYTYVVNTLGYDYNRVNQNPKRKGALAALESPNNSICMEFTDLFIAIARAAGIPARETVGYAYTTNVKLRPLSLVSDILHAWPEYYDLENQTWIPVDPTWAKTTGGINYFDKLDFNHIVFAIHGLKSDYPYPAGFYRRSPLQAKVVDVQFADSSIKHATSKLSTQIVFPSTVISGLESNGEVIIENTSGVGIDDINIAISSTPGGIDIQKIEKHLPPLTKISIPIKYKTPTIFTRGASRIIAVVNGEISQTQFSSQPILVYLALLFLLGIVIFVIIIAKRKGESR